MLDPFSGSLSSKRMYGIASELGVVQNRQITAHRQHSDRSYPQNTGKPQLAAKDYLRRCASHDGPVLEMWAANIHRPKDILT